jgi:H+-translocating NAD(P) transhydrogenase subunit beta
MTPDQLNLVYLLAAALFIVGLKGLTSPRTAVRGNLLGAGAMLIAAVATVVAEGVDLTWIAVGLVIGTALGIALAVLVTMEAMPQLVALFNGFGGGASVFVAGAYLIQQGTGLDTQALVATAASGLIGAVTFSGSLVAFAKLQELKFVKDVRFPGQQLLNGVLFLAAIGLCVLMVRDVPHQSAWYWAMSAIALSLGVFLVISIGGADMPVVIALLNSYSGLAASATGFVLNNTVLIIAGALVGASGLILTKIMCDAMNRSLPAVLFGTMQGGTNTLSNEEAYANVRTTTPEDVALQIEYANRVVIVPGYGMAVAQAQHAVRDLVRELTARGVEVEFAIHPVAGRMPGHMNVLLAEADIDYDRLKEMDAINPTLDQVDVAIVLGANDVVNPLARTDPQSPIAGMPIIDVDKCRSVIVIKRSLSPGFAGIPNPLFALDNTRMLFADGKAAIVEIVKALQSG